MCNSGSYGCLAQRSGRLLGLRLRSIELSIQGRLQIPARNQKYLIISIIAFQHKVCNGRGLTLIYTFQVQHSLHRSERNAVVTTRCWIRRWLRRRIICDREHHLLHFSEAQFTYESNGRVTQGHSSSCYDQRTSRRLIVLWVERQGVRATGMIGTSSAAWLEGHIGKVKGQRDR